MDSPMAMHLVMLTVNYSDSPKGKQRDLRLEMRFHYYSVRHLEMLTAKHWATHSHSLKAIDLTMEMQTHLLTAKLKVKRSHSH
jgi:hypothetical protein